MVAATSHPQDRVEITAAKHEADAKEAAAKAEATDKPGQLGPVYGKGGRGKKGGINQAARELGVPATQVKRAVKIASLSPEAKRLAKKLKAPQASSCFHQVTGIL